MLADNPLLERMEELGVPFLLHGEVTDHEVDVFELLQPWRAAGVLDASDVHVAALLARIGDVVIAPHVAVEATGADVVDPFFGFQFPSWSVTQNVPSASTHTPLAARNPVATISVCLPSGVTFRSVP